MDLLRLEKLGKVAGVAAVALGAVLVVLDRVVGQTGLLPEGWRGPLLIAVVLGAVVVAAAAITGSVPLVIAVILGAVIVAVVAIAGSARRNAQIARTEGDDSPATARDRSKAGGSQTAATKGDRSPATTERG